MENFFPKMTYAVCPSCLLVLFGNRRAESGMQLQVTRKLSGLPSGPPPKWLCFSWDPSGNFLVLGTADGRIVMYMDLMAGGQLSMQCSTRSSHSAIKQLHWKLPKDAAPTLCVLSRDGRLDVFEIGLDVCDGREGMVLKNICKIGGDPVESIAWSPENAHRQVIAIGRKGRNVCLLKAWNPQVNLQPSYIKQISGGIEDFKCAGEEYLVVTRTGNYMSKLHLESLPNPSTSVPQTERQNSRTGSLELQHEPGQDVKQSREDNTPIETENGLQLRQELIQTGGAQSALTKKEIMQAPSSSAPKPVRVSGHKRKISSLGSRTIFQENEGEQAGDESNKLFGGVQL